MYTYRDCLLLLIRDVDNNPPDPPQLLSDAPPQLLSDAPPFSGGFKMHDVCIYIHVWCLRRAVSRI